MTRTLVATPDPEPKPRYQVLPITTSSIHPGMAKFFPVTSTTSAAVTFTITPK